MGRLGLGWARAVVVVVMSLLLCVDLLCGTFALTAARVKRTPGPKVSQQMVRRDDAATTMCYFVNDNDDDVGNSQCIEVVNVIHMYSGGLLK